MTATGRATGQRRSSATRSLQAWLPYDIPLAVRAFYAHFRAGRGLPAGDRALAQPRRRGARARDPDLSSVNDRLSERSARGYARFAALTRTDAAARRSRASAAATRRGRGFGLRAGARATPIVTGNLEVRPRRAARSGPNCAWQSFRRRYGAVAGCGVGRQHAATARKRCCSTRSRGASLRTKRCRCIVPRHPQRFATVAELLARTRRALRSAQRARRRAGDRRTSRVVLGDSMGEMSAYYAAARTSPSSAAASCRSAAEPASSRSPSGTPVLDRAAHLQLRRCEPAGAIERGCGAARRRTRTRWSKPLQCCSATMRDARR